MRGTKRPKGLKAAYLAQQRNQQQNVHQTGDEQYEASDGVLQKKHKPNYAHLNDGKSHADASQNADVSVEKNDTDGENAAIFFQDAGKTDIEQLFALCIEAQRRLKSGDDLGQKLTHAAIHEADRILREKASNGLALPYLFHFNYARALTNLAALNFEEIFTNKFASYEESPEEKQSKDDGNKIVDISSKEPSALEIARERAKLGLENGDGAGKELLVELLDEINARIEFEQLLGSTKNNSITDTVKSYINRQEGEATAAGKLLFMQSLLPLADDGTSTENIETDLKIIDILLEKCDALENTYKESADPRILRTKGLLLFSRSCTLLDKSEIALSDDDEQILNEAMQALESSRTAFIDCLDAADKASKPKGSILEEYAKAILQEAEFKPENESQLAKAALRVLDDALKEDGYLIVTPNPDGRGSLYEFLTKLVSQ